MRLLSSMNNDILKKKYGMVKKTVVEAGFSLGIKLIERKNKTETIKKLNHIIKQLQNFDISTQYHNHILSDGKTYELHVQKDLLLLYRYEGDKLYINLRLLDITNHKTLGKKLGAGIEHYTDDDKSFLIETVEKHDELNPKLWDENGNLKPEVKEKILEIAKEFTAGLKEDGIKFDLKDIRLVGSNCSYNYTDKSDLDVHLIMDTDSLGCPDDLYPLLYSAYRSLFNGKLDIDFYGIPVELYVETE